ncbi:MAG: hypothetical protein DLM53_09350 [Candidatus Eremiobacter antarcticus]|nr:S8/S53 family peptidase [Candidatus Eremiobacteraeota bacterium]MBC5807523.1 S8/S53 family peptidase [Candidatus Eremiobacteraeota bacterium]PZR61425.1 MAG: hypothetical protein DLM53_09350 [Candidatus Eremiobacter sp. RRmetagenome_bin22]
MRPPARASNAWLLGCVCSIVLLPCAAVAGPRWTLPVAHKTLAPQSGRGTSFAYGAEVLQGARFLGLARLQTLNLNVGLRMRDEMGLYNYARLVSDPRSPYFRRFLTPEQLGDYFGAPALDQARAIGYFTSRGLSVRWWKQRQMLRVAGSQARMEQAFGTRFGVFEKNGLAFVAPVSAPHVLAPLAISGVGGLVSYHQLRRHIETGIAPQHFGGIGAGFLVGNSPFQIAAAFDYTGAYQLSSLCCKGDGITIGVIGTGPINTNDTGSAGDAVLFKAVFNVGGTGTVRQVNVSAVAPGYSSGVQPPPPVTPPCTLQPANYTVCNPEDIEAQLDTEQTNSLAPNANVLFYLAYNPNECYAPGQCPPGSGLPRLGINETDDEWQQAISDNVADVLTASFGIGELDFAGKSGGLLNADGTGIEPRIFASLSALGIAVFVSSADTGAEGCRTDRVPATADALCLSYPSSDPNVVSVGGTTTPIGSNGRLTGIITAWGRQTLNGGSGGGFSSVFARRAYQPPGLFCADDGRCDSRHRLTPDVALNADPATGVSVIINSNDARTGASLGGPQIGSFGGTSAAAPGMAAMWALVLQACKQTLGCGRGTGLHPYRLGNPAPLLYALPPEAAQAALLDITYGNNAIPSTSGTGYDPGFNAALGYDLTTGLGAPFARNLIGAIVGAVSRSNMLPASGQRRALRGARLD